MRTNVRASVAAVNQARSARAAIRIGAAAGRRAPIEDLIPPRPMVCQGLGYIRASDLAGANHHAHASAPGNDPSRLAVRLASALDQDRMMCPSVSQTPRSDPSQSHLT